MNETILRTILHQCIILKCLRASNYPMQFLYYCFHRSYGLGKIHEIHENVPHEKANSYPGKYRRPTPPRMLRVAIPSHRGSRTWRNVVQDTSGSIDESVIDFVDAGWGIMRCDHLVLDSMPPRDANSILSEREPSLVRSLIFYCSSGRDWIGSRTLLSLVGARLVIPFSHQDGQFLLFHQG